LTTALGVRGQRLETVGVRDVWLALALSYKNNVYLCIPISIKLFLPTAYGRS